MKFSTRCLLPVFLTVFTSSSVCAAVYDFQKDGIYYRIIDHEKPAVSVYPRDSGASGANLNAYSGKIVIPESVTFENVNYTVTAISQGTFQDCPGLTEVVVPPTVTEIVAKTFSSCSGLTSVSLPSTITTIGERAFVYSGLQTLKIPDSVTELGYAVCDGCKSLTEVTFGSAIKEIPPVGFQGCISLQTINFNAGLETVGSYAFSQCSGLKTFILPPAVKEIGYKAFSECRGMIKAAYPYGVFPASGGYTVAYSPENVIFENGFIYGPEKSVLYYVPYDYAGEYTLPEGCVRIESQAFAACSLDRIAIPSSVTATGDYVFAGSSVGDFVIENGEGTITLGSHLFHNADIENIYIDRDWKGNTIEVFSGSTVKNVTLGNNVTALPYSAFAACTMLQNFVIPNSVTAVDDSTFSGCVGLKDVTIGEKVASIGFFAFYNCPALSTLTVLASEPPALSDGTFSEEHYNNVAVTVPAGSLEKYKEHRLWGRFLSIQNSSVSNVSVSGRDEETARYSPDGRTAAPGYRGIVIIRHTDGSYSKSLIR